MFSCDKCTKPYHVKSSLSRHKRDAHENPPLRCDECNVIFASADSFRLHNIKKRETPYYEKETQTQMSCNRHGFQCIDCPRATYSYQEYHYSAAHLQQHLDAEPNTKIAQPYSV